MTFLLYLCAGESDSLHFLNEMGQALDLSPAPAGTAADCRAAASVQLQSPSTAAIR